MQERLAAGAFYSLVITFGIKNLTNRGEMRARMGPKRSGPPINITALFFSKPLTAFLAKTSAPIAFLCCESMLPKVSPDPVLDEMLISVLI